jgi:pyruvate dehydrogenase E2 component (dihydrolipoamide acetyltransferase)
MARKPDHAAEPPARNGAALAVAQPLAAPDVYPLSMMRKTIARRLTEAKQTVPHFYLKIDVDSGALVELREQINAELRGEVEHRHADDAQGAPPLKVSINDLVIKASALALVRVPACNAQFTPDAILMHRRVDISVAVAVPDGLVTPVVRDADKKSVVAIALEVRELAARARSKKLSLEEMTNGTFSISNLGMFGVDEFAAVINPPEGAILAVGQVREAPVVRDGALVVGTRMALTLSCDHRVVDGAVGAAFLAELRALLERPMRILTG